MTERERQQLLRAKAEEIVAALPAWDGESPAVLVTVVDPVTRQRLGHWFTPATVSAPQPQPRPKPSARARHLRLVEAS
ncbi:MULTISPECIES: hypothetical protein [unclassified Streptomyces]|uniref:hypothetical protein n=1 Tax=unclassified Streptomyces TaxID=2593676 RepID=UPI0033B55D05